MALGAGLDGTENLASAGILFLDNPAVASRYADWNIVTGTYKRRLYVWLAIRCANAVPRGVLPAVVRRCVWSRNVVKEEAVAHWELLRQKQTNKDVQMQRAAHRAEGNLSPEAVSLCSLD